MVGNEETLDSFELHICVKDYCFARVDKLVGVAVMQLKDIADQVINSTLIFTRYSCNLLIDMNHTGFVCVLVGDGQTLPHGRNGLDHFTYSLAANQ